LIIFAIDAISVFFIYFFHIFIISLPLSSPAAFSRRLR
jgi:hypothetical protein